MRVRSAIVGLFLVSACGGESCGGDNWIEGGQLGDVPCWLRHGPDTFDPICPTAVGGSQALVAGNEVDGPLVDRLTLTGDVFTLAPVDAQTVRLSAQRAGDDRLHFDDGEVSVDYDLAAAPVARVSLVPPRPLGWDPVLADSHLAAIDATVLVGAEHELTNFVALFDAAGERVVDEDILIALPAGAARDAEVWSAVTLPALAAGESLSLTVTSAGQDWPLIVRGVDQATDIQPVSLVPLKVDRHTQLCFVALADARPIIRAPLTVEAQGPLEVVQPTADACVIVRGQAVGTATLVVSGLGVTRSFEVVVSGE
jgi:hypothetical protein